jgi:hypothetical protein
MGHADRLCRRCKTMMPAPNPLRLYCPKCAVKVTREQTRNRKRMQRAEKEKVWPSQSSP